MSYIDDKLEIAEKVADILGGKPQVYLKRHMTYSDGTPRYEVVASDGVGPIRIKTVDQMNGRVRYWTRVRKDGKDFLFEGE